MENPAPPPNLTGSYLQIVSAVLLWSFWAIILRWLALPAPLVAFATNFFGWIFLLALVLPKRAELKKSFRGWRTVGIFSLVGLCVVLNNVLYFHAFTLTTVANVVFSHYLAPVLIFLLSPLFLREKLEGRAWFSLAVSLLGLYLVIHGPGLRVTPSDLRGIAFGVGSALFYALVVILFRGLTREYSILLMNFFANLFSFLLLLPVVVLRFSLALDPAQILALIILGILFSGLVPMLYLRGLKNVPAHHAGILSYLEPIGGVALARLFISEPVGANTIAGAALIIAAGYYLVRPAAPPRT